MNHIMLDIETLDTAPTAAILSIGAVKFDSSGYDKEDTFHRTIKIQSCLDRGLTVSGDTLAFWAGQSERARAVFNQSEAHDLVDVLGSFYAWSTSGIEPIVWGNGAAFDNVILANAYRKTQLPLPWKFWNDRCYRTVASLFPAPRDHKGILHDALDDAISQVEHLLKIAPGLIW